MIVHFIRSGFRQAKKNPSASLMMICSLALGLACCVFILIWVREELSFDRFTANIDVLFRVYIEDHFPDGRINAYGVTPGPLGAALKAEFAEVTDFARFRLSREATIRCGDRVFNEKEIAFADPAIVRLFTLPFRPGGVGFPDDPRSIILTESLGKKYFGSENPLGKSLTLDDRIPLRVAAVLKDPPSNFHLPFSALIPYVLLREYGVNIEDWRSMAATYTYLLLRDPGSASALSGKIRSYLKKSNPETITQLALQPVADIHLRSRHILGLGADGDVRYVYIFSVIGVFVLAIAVFNFVNLATAGAIRRSQEIGVRKASGASRPVLILQFLSESVVFAFFALSLAWIAVGTLLPSFNALSGKHVTLGGLLWGGWLIWTAMIALAVGLAAGFSPALVMSAFPAGRMIKRAPRSGRGAILRTVLVVSQFGLTMILTAGTILVGQQLRHMKKQDLGFEKNNLVSIPIPRRLAARWELLAEALASTEGVIHVAAASDLPTRVRMSTHGADWQGRVPNESVEMRVLYVDENYLKTMGMAMTEGRFFSREFPADREGEAFILNETAVRASGLTSPVGKWFELNKRGVIVGVVKDFHFTSLHQEVQPLLIAVGPGNFTHFLARIRPDRLGTTLAALQKTWEALAQGNPWEYGFVDERIDELYQAERRLGVLIKWFSGISHFLSGLGLLGLAVFFTGQRRKEIAIRRVCGATALQIVVLFLRTFILWVIIAVAAAGPLVSVLGNRWLSQFATRVRPGAGPLLVSGILAIAVTLLTVGIQALRSAVAAPCQALKAE